MGWLAWRELASLVAGWLGLVRVARWLGELGVRRRRTTGEAGSHTNVIPGLDRRGCWMGWVNGGLSSVGLARPDQIGIEE